MAPGLHAHPLLTRPRRSSSASRRPPPPRQSPRRPCPASEDAGRARDTAPRVKGAGRRGARGAICTTFFIDEWGGRSREGNGGARLGAMYNDAPRDGAGGFLPPPGVASRVGTTRCWSRRGVFLRGKEVRARGLAGREGRRYAGLLLEVDRRAPWRTRCMCVRVQRGGCCIGSYSLQGHATD